MPVYFEGFSREGDGGPGFFAGLAQLRSTCDSVNGATCARESAVLYYMTDVHLKPGDRVIRHQGAEVWEVTGTARACPGESLKLERVPVSRWVAWER